MVAIGMDGLDPDIVQRMMTAGDLPHFKTLADEGSFMRLETSNPPQSPVAWACFISGANPGQHDLFDFISRRPESYLPEIGMTETRRTGKKSFRDLFGGLSGPGLQTRRKGQSFWDHLSAHGIKSTIHHCPTTFPAQELRGRLLSGMGTPDIKGTQGIFSFFTTEEIVGKDIQGRAVKVVWQGDSINTKLTGPKIKKSKGSKEITVPIQITRIDSSRIRISCQSNSQEISIGQWSDWFRVKFKIGAFKSIYGIVRFHLNSIEPEFALYSSPVNIDPQAPALPISYPASYTKEIFEKIGNFYTQGMPYDTWALNEGRISEETFLEQAYSILEENLNAMRVELSRFDSGLLFIYFGITDLIQHMFWRYIDPTHPNRGENPNPEVRNAIENSYKRMDSVLGEIRDQLDEKTLLMVISDHGFGSFRRAVHINSWLRNNGYLSLKENAKEGKELFINVDWNRTKAYSLGFGGIYINQFGREKNGIVYQGADMEKIKKEISEKLQPWRDSDGSRIIKKIYRSQDLYSGPYTQNGPDLFIGFEGGYRASWQTALGATPEVLIEDNMKKWGGDHLVDPSLVPGVLFLNKKILRENPTILDIAPTILTYFGVAPAEQLEGEPLF